MIVRTDFPCGNGRILWIKPGHFDVEVVAYSKSARYVCFRISHVKEARELDITLRPDRYFNSNFGNAQVKIWVQRGLEGDWIALDEAKIGRSPEAIRITLSLRPDEIVTVSTEPPRPYGTTTRELFQLAEQHSKIASIRSIGASMEERPLLVLRIADPSREEKRRPMILGIAGEHATEAAGEEIMRGVLAAILRDDAVGNGLREDYDFEFLFNANPDGNFHGWHQYNLKDWKEHNYADNKDRSWHHEFGDFFRGCRESLSPETIAIGKWVEEKHPSFILNAHSWTGHGGNPGAFRTAPELLEPKLRAQMESLDAGAKAVAKTLGFEFEVYPSSNLCGGHVVDLVMENGYGVGYAVEGNPFLERELAQLFGSKVIEHWLYDRALKLD